MDRVAELLRVLFRRALSAHERPPALTNVVVGRASTRFGPSLAAEFSNGYRTWAELSPGAFFSSCERFAVRDFESLRTILLSQGQEIYAEMIEARTRRTRPARRSDEMLQILRHDQRSALFEEIRSPSELAHRRSAPQRSLRQRWGEWWYNLCAVRRRRIINYVPTAESQKRGARLLKENLTPAQRHQYERCGYFEVRGGESGTSYRIRHGSQMNVERLDKGGRGVCVLCFVPEGGLVVGDIMLAQKIALELFESEAVAVANKMPTRLRAIA